MKKLFLLIGLVVFLTPNAFANKYIYDGEWEVINQSNCEKSIGKLIIKKNKVKTSEKIKGKVKKNSIYLSNKFKGEFNNIVSLKLFSTTNECFFELLKSDEDNLMKSHCIGPYQITCFCKRPDDSTYFQDYEIGEQDHCGTNKYNNKEISYGEYLKLDNDNRTFNIGNNAKPFQPPSTNDYLFIDGVKTRVLKENINEDLLASYCFQIHSFAYCFCKTESRITWIPVIFTEEAKCENYDKNSINVTYSEYLKVGWLPMHTELSVPINLNEVGRKFSYEERACMVSLGNFSPRCLKVFEQERLKNRSQDESQQQNKQSSRQTKGESSDDGWPTGPYQSGYQQWRSKWGAYANPFMGIIKK